MSLDPADLPVILLFNLDPAWPAADAAEVLNLVHGLEISLSKVGHPLETIRLEDDQLERAMAGCDPNRQIVFNWCEEVPGIPRSSSRIACTLEELGFVFTGADSQALLFSQDKPAVKGRLRQRHIPTPDWQVFGGGGSLDWDRFPAIVKPAYEHFSFGITHEAVVHNRVELLQRLIQVTETFQEPALVEDFIDGREFHVSVVGNGKLQVFPIAEMDFSAIREDSGRVCTYDSKFSPTSADYQMIQLRLPAMLSDQEKAGLEKTAIAAYKATECRDYARLDIRQRDGIFYVLDVNPNADISPDTSLALSAQMAGFSHGQFGSLLVSLAAHRHPLFGRKTARQARQIRTVITATD
jgi:D-alanine-D-alanine ligase